MASFTAQAPRNKSTAPDPPGTIVARLHAVERDLVLEGVHGRPVAAVTRRPQAFARDQAVERLLDQLFAFLHVFEDVPSPAEEAAVDPGIRSGYRLQAGHHVASVALHRMKALRWAHRNEAGDRLAPLEFGNVVVEREIAQAVRIVGQKHLFALDVLAHAQ